MNKWLAFGVILAFITVGDVLIVWSRHVPSLPHRPQAQSWDQKNLKRLAPPPSGNSPCPGVFDAPGGNLRFCQ
jgi:hypothetical protein